MNFQILDADYSIYNDEPVVRLFGRGEDGSSACCFVPGFEPYFYAKVADNSYLQTLPQFIKNKFDTVKDVEPVQRFEPIGYQESKKPMFKITTFYPKNVPEIRDDVQGLEGIEEVYETDILFKNRFMIDKGLHGMALVSAEPAPASESINDRDVKCDNIITSYNVEEINKIPNIGLKYLAFDIECLPPEGGMPEPESSPIIMISLSFEPEYKGNNTLVLVCKNLKDVESDIEIFDEEEDMLTRFFDIFQEYDPDVIVGYNMNDFDIPYIKDRADYLNNKGASIVPSVGRDGRLMTYRRLGTRTMVSITGRIVMDTLPIIRQQFSLKRYTLRNVSKELLGREKLDVEPHQMVEYWKDGGEKTKKFIDYARRDSELALELVTKLQLLDKYIALSQVSGSVLQDVVDGGQSSMVENLLFREFGKQGRVIPPKPDNRPDDNEQGEEIKGGEVLEPKKGLLDNVVILDYKSLYPTIMMAHNLCYTTVVVDDHPHGETINPPSGGEFVNPDVLKGIVPSILETLLNQRSEVKKKMKSISDGDTYRMYDATQLALKILLNSFYGYSGYARARLYSLTLANAVTSYGRENIQNTRDLINNNIRKVVLKDNQAYLPDEISPDEESEDVINLSVVYGDTDSVFIHCLPEYNDDISLEDAERVGTKIAEKVSQSLPDPMELEFESIAKRGLFLAKKRYALWVFEQENDEWEDSVKVKGMETIRRDWCELTSKTLNRVLELVLKEGDVDKAVEYVRSVVNRVRNIDVQKDKDVIDDLTMTRLYSKKKDSYKSKQPHLTVIEKTKKRTGISPPIGERVPFVIVAGNDLFVNRAEDPEYVRENNLTLDVDYYIKKQILPPVERILSVFGVDSATLDYDSRQKGLFDFSKISETESFNNANKETTDEEDNGLKNQSKNGSKSQSSLFDF
ncbi:DNA-directed DNA polymerase [Methanohalobium sp.]|uniref:DNA-directed DNA polymerase n=1 Tax=Methanohalobium sp. TaxID=2837493 RepID=UPI0025F3A8FD|nr:DNA-directed DNA polymerase [Methanohalobium sp.]